MRRGLVDLGVLCADQADRLHDLPVDRGGDQLAEFVLFFVILGIVRVVVEIGVLGVTVLVLALGDGGEAVLTQVSILVTDCFVEIVGGGDVCV